MKTTLIGHACIVFESKGTTLLSDPCLFSLHFEELNYYFPRVEIHPDKFKRPDAVYISHRHQDHFDIRTLAYMPKDLKLLCPDDAILLDCIKELGYQDITVVKDFEPVQVKDLTLIPTPSLTQDYYPEHGLIIQDGEVNIWNQVDTIVSPDIIQYINRICGRVDFAHVRFEPLLEQNFTYHKDTMLPFEEYSSFLKVAGALSPKFAVPGSAGEHFHGAAEFLNHFVFPATQEQFIGDLEKFSPEIRSSTFLPGDVAEISATGTKIHRQQSELVTRQEEENFRTAFNPLYEVPRIRTLTEDSDQRRKEKEAVTQFLLDGTFVEKLKQSEVMAAFQHWGLGYRLELFDEDESDIWYIDFSKEPVLQRGYFGRVNLYEGISYSELYRLIEGTTNWDFVGSSGNYRTFHNIYRVDQGNFEYYPQAKKFPQPLQEVFPPNRDMDREKFMKDVRRWKGKYDGAGPAW